MRKACQKLAPSARSSPEIRVAKFLRFKTCQRRFCDGAKLTEANRKNLRRRWPYHISKAGCYPRRHSVCRGSQFLRVFGGFVGFGIVTELLPAQAHCCQRIQSLLCVFSRFCWALNCGIVVACTGAVFYENLDLPWVFSKDFEADRCNAAIVWADKMFRAGMEPSWMIHHCALLQILQRPGEASFVVFTYEQFYVQFSPINLVGRSEKDCHPVFAASWACVRPSPTRIFIVGANGALTI